MIKREQYPQATTPATFPPGKPNILTNPIVSSTVSIAFSTEDEEKTTSQEREAERHTPPPLPIFVSPHPVNCSKDNCSISNNCKIRSRKQKFQLLDDKSNNSKRIKPSETIITIESEADNNVGTQTFSNPSSLNTEPDYFMQYINKMSTFINPQGDFSLIERAALSEQQDEKTEDI